MVVLRAPKFINSFSLVLSEMSKKMGFSFLKRACNKLDEGKHQIDDRHFPEAISACQEFIEFSIKSVFHFVGVKFPPEHKFLEENFRRVLEETSKCAPKVQGIERLYIISEFWLSMYNISKYGCGKIGVGPERLFKKREASFALQHAYECYSIARSVYYECAPMYYSMRARR